jgi:hypothetical protein
MHLLLHAKCPIFSTDFNQIWNFSTDFFIIIPYIKFHGNPSSGSRGDKCVQTDGHCESHRRFSRTCYPFIKVSHSVAHNHSIRASRSHALPPFFPTCGKKLRLPTSRDFPTNEGLGGVM